MSTLPKHILDQFTGISQLESNWDGYDADPIPDNIQKKLMSALEKASLSDISGGNTIPGADGSLQAEWHLDTISVGLIVEPDGSLAAWRLINFKDQECSGNETIATFTTWLLEALAA